MLVGDTFFILVLIVIIRNRDTIIYLLMFEKNLLLKPPIIQVH